MGIKAFITGVAGAELTDEERGFLVHEHPWGLILFARNIEGPRQVHRLIDEFRELVGRGDAPVLIDQEGGRVQRLRPPNWENYATAWQLGELWRHDHDAGGEAIRLHSQLVAHDLAALGINVDCLPVLDVPVDGAHDVIGDRAYSRDPAEVAIMARLAAEALMQGGVLPVIKHIPGHGRAAADSHLELPVVDASHAQLAVTDFAPFRAMNDMPIAMTAHVLYSALDAERPATLSPDIINGIIRGEIGFDGLLISDDLSMQALDGDLGHRADAAIAAGCDVILHCNGDMREMEEIAAVCPVLDGKPLERAGKAMAMLGDPAEFDVDAARARYRDLLAPSV